MHIDIFRSMAVDDMFEDLRIMGIIFLNREARENFVSLRWSADLNDDSEYSASPYMSRGGVLEMTLPLNPCLVYFHYLLDYPL